MEVLRKSGTVAVEVGRIAVAQTCPRAGDVAANMEEHLSLATLAADAGASVVVFPELSLTGYEIGLAAGLAFDEDDARLDPLKAQAARHDVTLIAGAPVRLDSGLHIGAFIVMPDGTTDVYTKRRLGAFSSAASVDGVVPPAEATVFGPGSRDPLVRVGEALAAVAVCADIGDPAHAEQAAARGAASYLASMFVIPSDYDAEAAALAAYARRHALVVAMANYGAPSGGLSSAGRSTIWSETGEIVVHLDAAGAGVAIATRTTHGWSAHTVMLPQPSFATPPS